MSAIFRLNNEESDPYTLKVGFYHNKFQNRGMLRDRKNQALKVEKQNQIILMRP